MLRSKLALVCVSTVSPCLAQGPYEDRLAAEEINRTESARWNQWRGPHRTGQCAGPAWPNRLTKENLVQQWRVPLNPSYSGPVVDGRHVYTTETRGKSHEFVFAFDRETGKEVWNTSWKGAMTVPFFAARNGSWIRSTPTLDGDALYVAGIRDVVACLEAETGKQRWRVDLAKRFETPISKFGFVCSPLVVEDAVFVQAAAGLVKLDKRTGKTIWRSLKANGGMMGGAFSSPVFAEAGGTEQLLVQTRMELKGVDAESGETLWSIPVRTSRGMNILTPLPYEGGVFTSAYGGRAHYYTLDKKGGKFEVAEKWSNRAQGYMTSPVVVDGHAYLYLRSNRFCCVNLEEGTMAWTSKPIGDGYWSLVAQGNRMLALSDKGELYLIAANPEEFEIIDRMQVADGDTWAHLAVDDGQVFIRELGALTAFTWQ